jgi:ribosome maturation factor RimP
VSWKLSPERRDRARSYSFRHAMPTAAFKLRRMLLFLCVAYSHAFLVLHRGALHRREYIYSRCIILAQEAMAPADEGGPFAGPFWDALCNEAREEAEELGLTITKMSYASGKLSVLASGGGLDELQALNTHLSSFVDEQDEATMEALPPFLLEVSSPGLSSILATDLDFSAFKGFPVTATTTEPFKDKTVWEGTLVGRDDEFVTINLKGRLVKLPRSIVGEVALPKSKREPGDPYS